MTESFKQRKDAVFKALDATRINIASIHSDEKDEGNRDRSHRKKSTRREEEDDVERCIDSLIKRNLADSQIRQQLKAFEDITKVSELLSRFERRLKSGAKIRNPLHFLRAMIVRLKMDTSRTYKKYDLSNVDDMTSCSNTRAALSFLSEIQSKKRMRVERATLLPCTKGLIKFKIPTTKAKNCPKKKKQKLSSSKATKKMKQIALSHLLNSDSE